MIEETPSFQRAMDQGHSAAWEMAWDQAASFYRKALNENPDHPQALVSLGLALFELGSYEQALKCYIKAARISPDDPMPMEKISQIYKYLGNLERAYQAALHSADLYLKNGDIRKAIENWERARTLQPEDQKAYPRLAEAYDRCGDKEQAVQAYLTLASLQQGAGDTQTAKESVDKALQCSPTSPKALQYAALLKALKPLPKVEKKPIRTSEIIKSQVTQPEATSEQVNLDSGLNAIESACQKALAQLALILFDSSEVETSGAGEHLPLKSIVTGTAKSRKSSDQTLMLLHLSQLIELQSRKEYALAVNELQRAMDAGLDHPAATFDLGYIMIHTGMTESAIQPLERAASHPDFALGARLMVGEIYYQKDQMMQAALEYLEALKLADLLTSPPSRQDDLRQRYEPLLEAYRLQPDASSQARLVEDIKHLLMRRDWQEQILRIRSQFPDSGVNQPLAEMFTELGGNQLIQALSRVRELKSQRRSLSAMEEVYYALEIAPTYLPLHTLMAELLVDMGEFQQAVEKYLVIARVYSMRGEALQAAMLYRKVLGVDPADLSVRRHLIDELVVSGRNHDAVIETMQLAEVHISLADLPMARMAYIEALQIARSHKVDPGIEVKILKRVADIDMQSLDWKQAVLIYEQIRKARPHDRETRHQLVNLYLRLGQEEAASRVIVDYVEFARGNNQPELISPFIEELRRDHPENLSLWTQLNDIYRHQ